MKAQSCMRQSDVSPADFFFWGRVHLLEIPKPQSTFLSSHIASRCLENEGITPRALQFTNFFNLIFFGFFNTHAKKIESQPKKWMMWWQTHITAVRCRTIPSARNRWPSSHFFYSNTYSATRSFVWVGECCPVKIYIQCVFTFSFISKTNIQKNQ